MHQSFAGVGYSGSTFLGCLPSCGARAVSCCKGTRREWRRAQGLTPPQVGRRHGAHARTPSEVAKGGCVLSMRTTPNRTVRVLPFRVHREVPRRHGVTGTLHPAPANAGLAPPPGCAIAALGLFWAANAIAFHQDCAFFPVVTPPSCPKLAAVSTIAGHFCCRDPATNKFAAVANSVDCAREETDNRRCSTRFFNTNTECEGQWSAQCASLLGPNPQCFTGTCDSLPAVGCTLGAASPCNVEFNPSPKCGLSPSFGNELICDGFDNDCDRDTDEGFGCKAATGGMTSVGSLCSGGVNPVCPDLRSVCECQCATTTSTACGPKLGVSETCNTTDDDCDCQVDEGLGSTSCGTGECGRTVQNCVNGSPQTCTPGPRTTEICDGKDNDCDGAVDEDVF